MQITPSEQVCGARVTDIDLGKPLSETQINGLRAAWLQYHVLAFPDQDLSDDDLERFTLYFGEFGEDPFIAPIDGREHIIAVQRAADESAPVFAEAWHTDWSFQEIPPAGTCLYGITIPPTGGDTLFIDQHRALAMMPAELRSRLEGKQAIHSAQLAYAPEGMYGEDDDGRSMQIIPSEEAREMQLHPLIRAHPESGEETLYGTIGYIIGIDGMPQDQAEALLMEMYAWQTREEFIYRHQWQAKTLLMWDNRSLLHAATGGYDGHARYLHRTTIADRPQ